MVLIETWFLLKRGDRALQVNMSSLFVSTLRAMVDQYGSFNLKNGDQVAACHVTWRVDGRMPVSS